MTMPSILSCRWSLAISLPIWAVMTSVVCGQFNSGGANWQQGNRWQLGVRVQNTTTGVALEEVQPGSPAANAGLAPGDRILAIGGRQVGYVDGNLIDLGDAINQQMGSAGQVTALLQSNRFGLAARPLSLKSGSNVIEGTAFFQGSAPLSPQAVLNIRLSDVTNNWTGVVVTQWAVAAASFSPFPFRLSYYPQQIYSGHEYALEAELVDQGRVVYRTSRATKVVPGTGRISISLDPVATQLANISGNPAFPYEQVQQWYQTYLRRPPTQQELSIWENHVKRGQPVADIQSNLLGSTEYYSRFQNSNDLYLRGIFRTLYDRDPTPQEMNAMIQRFSTMDGVRSKFVQNMLAEGSLE